MSSSFAPGVLYQVLLDAEVPNPLVHLAFGILHHHVLTLGQRILRPDPEESIPGELLLENRDRLSLFDRLLRQLVHADLLDNTHALLRSYFNDGEGFERCQLEVELGTLFATNDIFGVFALEFERGFAGEDRQRRELLEGVHSLFVVDDGFGFLENAEFAVFEAIDARVYRNPADIGPLLPGGFVLRGGVPGLLVDHCLTAGAFAFSLLQIDERGGELFPFA